MKWRALVVVAGGLAMWLAGCEEAEKPAEAAPEVSAPASTATAPEEENGGMVGVDAGVEAASKVNMDVEDAENRLVKAEVLTRIDLIPDLTENETDKLYVQVERARGMGKMLTISFATAKNSVSAQDVEALRTALALPQFQAFSSDPTVVFVVLGFADKAGDPDRNLVLSRTRADAVAKALKEQLGVLNVVHSVGMGSSEMFDAVNLDKNRVVEIWAVLP